jgi:hypothetical protein
VYTEVAMMQSVINLLIAESGFGRCRISSGATKENEANLLENWRPCTLVDCARI